MTPYLSDREALDRAVVVAIQAHAGVCSKDGDPYILHPLRLATRLLADGYTLQMATIALLHDVVEDTPTTVTDLTAMGFSSNVTTGVDLMTRRSGEGYPEYIKRMRERADVMIVKYYDMDDNLDVSRLNRIPDVTTRERLAEKYELGKKLLIGYGVREYMNPQAYR